MKIGITFSLIKGSKDSIWSNGLKLNIMIFIDLLKQSKKKYDVFLLGYGGDIVEDKPDFLGDVGTWPRTFAPCSRGRHLIKGG